MCRTGYRGYLSLLVTLGLLLTVLPGSVQAGNESLPDSGPTFDVNVDIALPSLVSLGDGHLQKM
jgi:hypothetical protein